MAEQNRPLPSVRADALSGFLVFLIAMPLCLAIAKASGFPPIAGIWTAVIGGIISTLISNSELTIKGPAAGLIVIVAGAVTQLGDEFAPDAADKAWVGYRLALGIGVAAGLIQILGGLLRAGRITDLFPLTPVHGMLASIGLIIIAKQAYTMMGAATPEGEPLHLLYLLPFNLLKANPEILFIGAISLIVLFGLPLFKSSWVKLIPAQLVVLVLAIALGFYFDLEHQHKYPFPSSWFGGDGTTEYEVGPRFLVDMPNVLSWFSGKADPDSLPPFNFPDFRGLATLTGLKYLLLFVLIGSLESLLAAKAIDLLDPWKRKTNFDRDLLAIGVGNTIAALVGALPMISEIVRSSANINNGARTRWANCWHSLFLLAFVLLFPNLIHSIPLAALAAMLIYTGFRLASPREFLQMYKLGSEQFVVFVTTIVVTLATDLLIGILAGIALKVIILLWNGAPLRSLVRADFEARPSPDKVQVVLVVRQAAVFSNWVGLQAAIIEQAKKYETVVVDLSATRVVDHTVMEKLHEMEMDLDNQGRHLSVIGLEGHQPMSAHPMAARRKPALAAM